MRSHGVIRLLGVSSCGITKVVVYSCYIKLVHGTLLTLFKTSSSRIAVSDQLFSVPEIVKGYKPP